MPALSGHWYAISSHDFKLPLTQHNQLINAVAQHTQTNAQDGRVRSDIRRCVVTLYCTLKRGHAGCSCHGGTAICLQLFCLIQSGKPYIINNGVKVRYDGVRCISIKGKFSCFFFFFYYSGLILFHLRPHFLLVMMDQTSAFTRLQGLNRQSECLTKLGHEHSITLQTF